MTPNSFRVTEQDGEIQTVALWEEPVQPKDYEIAEVNWLAVLGLAIVLLGAAGVASLVLWISE